MTAGQSNSQSYLASIPLDTSNNCETLHCLPLETRIQSNILCPCDIAFQSVLQLNLCKYASLAILEIYLVLSLSSLNKMLSCLLVI